MYLNKFQRDSRFFFDLLASDQISWAKIMYYLYQVAWNIFHTIFNNSLEYSFEFFFLKKKKRSYRDLNLRHTPISRRPKRQSQSIHTCIWIFLYIYRFQIEQRKSPKKSTQTSIHQTRCMLADKELHTQPLSKIKTFLFFQSHAEK